MEIEQFFLTENTCYKQGKLLSVQGLTLHSVGCAQPSSGVFINNWNKPGITKCVHAFINSINGRVAQTMPWTMRGWHGGGAVNNTHIGVEMCETKGVKYDSNGKLSEILDYDLAVKNVTTTYNTAVELFAMLCEKYNLDPLKKGVIVSHSEAHALGIASNHGDPEHLWKYLKLSYTMDGFRKAVAEKMGKVVIEEIKPDPIENNATIIKSDGTLQVAQHFDKAISGAYVCTDEEGLNIRIGAGVTDAKGNENTIIGVLPLNAECKCYGYYNYKGSAKWYLIQYKGIVGYCHSKYIRKK